MGFFSSKSAAKGKPKGREQSERSAPRTEPQLAYEDEVGDNAADPFGDEPYDLGQGLPPGNGADPDQDFSHPPPEQWQPPARARGPASTPVNDRGARPDPAAPKAARGTVPTNTDASGTVAGEGWLTARGIKKAYGRRQVVKGVNLSVRRGEAVGLLGPNGAGKTTVFYMITGLVPADDGKILIDGNDATTLPMYRRARLGIGYLPQEASIFRGLTVEQNIMAVLELVEPNRKRRKEQLDSLLEEFRITRLRKSPSIALSGGERRRCEIARALASRPSFILLDEPFAGIDPIAVGDIQVLVQHLTQRGIGVLITDHNVRETLNLIDRAYIIYDGQVLTQGTPEEVIANPDVRRVYLGDMKL